MEVVTVNWQSDEAVFVYRADLAGWPDPADMKRAAHDLLAAMGVDAGGRRVLLKPNVVVGEAVDSGISVHPAFLGGAFPGTGSARIRIRLETKEEREATPSCLRVLSLSTWVPP